MVVGSTVPGFAQESAVVAAQPAAIMVEPAAVPVAPVAVEPSAPAAPAPAQSVETSAVESPAVTPVAVPANARSLAQLVRDTPHREPENAELRCLATGVFFESQGESLPGQLAVAHVIINRAESGRFARSLCGVLTQRGQFSFVRGGVIPSARPGAQWRTAVAIARIAQAEGWANPAPGALFFHAARLSPQWNRPRIARIDNHIFYR